MDICLTTDQIIIHTSYLNFVKPYMAHSLKLKKLPYFYFLTILFFLYWFKMFLKSLLIVIKTHCYEQILRLADMDSSLVIYM